MGMANTGKVKHLKRQKYESLKKSCVSRGTLFEDSTFPAADSSLGFPKSVLSQGKIEWKRPHELPSVSEPKLVVDRLNSSNITQGCLGNCWFVAACCSLAREKELWSKVVPNDQDFNPGSAKLHGGLFHFRIWRFGVWYDIVVDDRLPTINGRLAFAHSQQHNEFWCSLLEKAYAKLFGSYAAMEGGNLIDALVDFTAGFAERIFINKDEMSRFENEPKKLQLYKYLKDEMMQHSLMCCAIKASTPNEINSRTDCGLIKGHAYCVTNIKRIPLARTGLLSLFKGRDKLNMIRMRNPWGEKEWTGSFSDGSMEWNKVSAKDRQKVGLTLEDDGEFWMTFEDYCAHFTDISICYLINTSWFSFGKTWSEAAFYGQWTVGAKGSKADRAGGCSNHLKTFFQNPQYCFDIKSEEDTLLIMIQQKDIPVLERKPNESRLKSIGLQILKVEVNRKCRIHRVHEIVSTSDYIETRNIFHKCVLKQGRYVIIPSTFMPGNTADFLLRVFSGSNINLRELKLDVPKAPLLSCVHPYCVGVVLRIKEAKDLKEPLSSEVCSPYFIIYCEQSKVRGPTVKNDANPQWNLGISFYCRDSKPKLKIQMWNSKLLKDVLLSETELELTVSWSGDTVEQITLPLKSINSQVVGHLIFEKLATTDMLAM
ncbi:Calpain-5 [Chamberlinius hualienensis]